uniref:FACT complex subunit n=1 Tax=Steinernema glaseri TaxID=37863 RepID=A0A1I7XYN4_9BILA
MLVIWPTNRSKNFRPVSVAAPLSASTWRKPINLSFTFSLGPVSVILRGVLPLSDGLEDDMAADDNGTSPSETTLKIRNILVMPPAELLLAKHAGLNDASKEFIGFVDDKIEKCRKPSSNPEVCQYKPLILLIPGTLPQQPYRSLTTTFQAVQDSSAVVFTANSLQSRAIPIEIAVYLTRIYQELGVNKTDDFIAKTNEILSGENCAPQTTELIRKLYESITAWDTFLQEVDDDLERLVGPTVNRKLDRTEGIAIKDNTKSVKSDHLISYINDSPFDMVFIGVIMSFANPDTAEYIMNVYQKESDFHKRGCDILLLTKGNGTDGGGFLKLIGIPFRMLLNEQEAMARLLQHRVSALTLAGAKAVHLFAEIGCNDDSLKMDAGPKDENSPSEVPLDLAIVGGSALVDREGKVLYSFVGKESKDWPSVDTILEQVKLHNKAAREVAKKTEEEEEPTETAPTSQQKTKAVENAESKCCTIL